jgi:hypothetical protein
VARRGALRVALIIAGSDGLKAVNSEACGTCDRSHRFLHNSQQVSHISSLSEIRANPVSAPGSTVVHTRPACTLEKRHAPTPVLQSSSHGRGSALWCASVSRAMASGWPPDLEQHRLQWLAAALRRVCHRLPAVNVALSERPRGRFRARSGPRSGSDRRRGKTSRRRKAQGAQWTTFTGEWRAQSDGPLYPGLALYVAHWNHQRAWPLATRVYTAACLALSAASRSPRPVLSASKNQSAISPEVTKIVSSRRISRSSAFSR